MGRSGGKWVIIPKTPALNLWTEGEHRRNGLFGGVQGVLELYRLLVDAMDDALGGMQASGTDEDMKAR